LSNRISNKDKKDWLEFIENKEKLPDKDSGLRKNIIYKTRNIDLHGYSLDDANKKIKDFIKKAYEDKVSKITVVTGKGLHSNKEKDPYVSKDFSILKYSVPEFINKDKNLMDIILEIKEAKIEDGGSGAFYIYLKKNKK
tara:strand:- start:228 stop:644 length:417 start_codon:yes stop_codon:yes gene_type:complete